MLLVILIFVTVLSVDAGDANTCRCSYLYTHLNSKTPYPRRPIKARKERIDQTECPNGKLIYYNLVARHGTRFPTGGDTRVLLALQNTLKAKAQYIRNPRFSWLQTWVSPYTVALNGLLDVTGQVEHYNLSKRIEDRYDPFFSLDYLPTIYPIQTTQVSRASISGSAFGFGLFEGKGTLGPTNFQPFYMYSDTASVDNNLRFFDNCPVYVKNVTNNPESVLESELYLNDVMPEIIEQVRSTLNVDPSQWNITSVDIDGLFTACSFDVSLNSVTDKFCSIFTKKSVLQIETATDLESYWTMGYGYPINYQISCRLLTDFFNSFDKALLPGAVEKSKLRFAHAETLIPLVTLLGLFKDNFVLRWNSTNLDNRVWHDSIISPFAGNLAMGLYNCSGTYKVKLTHNEGDVKFPSCDTLYCPYNTLKNTYKDYLNCNFGTLCAL